MAVIDSSIEQIRSQLSSLTSSVDQFNDQLNTISYVKNNNDIATWTDGTAIGSKWVDSVTRLADTEGPKLASDVTNLIKETNAFLDEQAQINQNG